MSRAETTGADGAILSGGVLTVSRLLNFDSFPAASTAETRNE
jgi:hypothetical protein